MQRTEYFDQTRPTETQLNWAEDSKVAALLRRTRALSQMGVVSGFQVTVNGADNTKIDIAGGEGYTGGLYRVNSFEGSGSGERVATATDTVTGEADVGTVAVAQSLADYTASVANYVSIVHSEVESYPLEERSYPFTSHNTVVTEHFTVSVLSETDWNTLTSAQLNNRVLVAIVTANGAGVALTSASIESFTQPKTLPTATQPGTLAGVTITGLADTTPLGTATLRWETSTNKLYYTAPGDSEGTGIQITDSGSVTLSSASTAYTITLTIIFASLSALGDTSENITIRSLYGRTIPMFSAVDQIHRDMVGSGQPSEDNPHGITLANIGGGTLDHADLFHLNGISNDADVTQLECSIGANGGPYEDMILIQNLGGYNNSFMIDGGTLTSLSGVVDGSAGIVSFDVTPTPNRGDYLVYLDSTGAPQKVMLAGHSSTWPFWSTNLKLYDMKNASAGTGTVTWDGTALTWQSPQDASAGASVYVSKDDSGAHTGFYKLYSDSVEDWIIVSVEGDLGGANSSNITVVKDETTYSDETLLKLAIVHWQSTTEILSELRDLRRFVTADNRPQTEEEHDSTGKHTKPFQNTLYVNVGTANEAINATASESAIYGYADTQAIRGVASYEAVYGTISGALGHAVVGEAGWVGVKASATETALHAVADDSYAVYAEAPYQGVYGGATLFGVNGYASSSAGVYGHAATVGVQGAATNTGVFGTASNSYGVYGAADNYGVYGAADAAAADSTAIGVYGIATADSYPIGVMGTANTDGIGVYGLAGAADPLADSVDNIGVVGQAQRVGVFGTVSGAGDVVVKGVVGEAVNTVVAASAIGVYGSVNGVGAIGVYGAGINGIGVEAYGSATGIYLPIIFGGGAAQTGIQIEKALEYGASVSVEASADTVAYGVNVIARNTDTASNAIGVHAFVTGVSATAVVGVASNGTAIYGYGNIGLQGYGNTAVYAQGLVRIDYTTTGDPTGGGGAASGGLVINISGTDRTLAYY
jgi:hypothetical protein